MTTQRLPTFYLTHGGGPWPWMPGPAADAHARLAEDLRRVPRLAGGKPRAVLMVSAHWEAPEFSLMTHPRPPILYDYSNFPADTYRVTYPAPGAPPELVEKTEALLRAAGIAVRRDPARGFDHGTFVPMHVAWPQADVPILQLSLKRGLDPSEHLAAGRALAPLRDEGVLVVGSGSSFHNLRALGPEGKEPSAAFDAWLSDTLLGDEPEQRSAALTAWEAAPAARQSHPREEHLLPLMVAAGAAGNDCATRLHHQSDFFGSATVSSFMFGSTPGQP
ncbi:MAG: DODA-type extradiol aromatic ring-opening family dioxygenase [Caldimonas sp.]